MVDAMRFKDKYSVIDRGCLGPCTQAYLAIHEVDILLHADKEMVEEKHCEGVEYC